MSECIQVEMRLDLCVDQIFTQVLGVEFLILLSFARDFAVLHFTLFSDRVFELQLLAQFLTDFPKICTMYLSMCNLHG